MDFERFILGNMLNELVNKYNQLIAEFQTSLKMSQIFGQNQDPIYMNWMIDMAKEAHKALEETEEACRKNDTPIKFNFDQDTKTCSWSWV